MNRLLHAAAALALCCAPPAAAQTVHRWIDKDGVVHYSDQPPPPDARQAQEKDLRSGNVVDTSGPGYEARRAAEKHPVTLYTSADCKAECADARKLLQARGVPYAEAAIKEAADFAAYRQKFGGGDPLVPSLAVGTQTLKGLQEESWQRALDDAGYPRSAAPGAGRPPAR